MEKEYSFFERFFIKMFIGTFLLFCMVMLDYFKLCNLDSIKTKMSEHINILEVIKKVNGKEVKLIPLNLTDEEVMNNYYPKSKIKNGYCVDLGNFNGVENYSLGVIIKVNNYDDLFEITIKGNDDKEYIYNNLKSVDVSMYQIVEANTILGEASKKEEGYYYNLYIKDDGKYIDIFSSN